MGLILEIRPAFTLYHAKITYERGLIKMLHKSCSDDNWVLIPKPNPLAPIRLFLFPYAGGSSQIYRKWLKIAPDFFEICLIELPGHGRRFHEECYSDIEELTEDLAEGILPYLNKPFIFFGHSMGALISYELAKMLLIRYNISPLHLFISAHRSPEMSSGEPVMYDLPESALIVKLEELKGMPREIFDNRELLEILLPVIRSDFKMCETYALKRMVLLNCPITALCGIDDHYARSLHMHNWSRYTTNNFELINIEGNHFFLLEKEHKIIEVISTSIKERKELCQAGYSDRTPAYYAGRLNNPEVN